MTEETASDETATEEPTNIEAASDQTASDETVSDEAASDEVAGEDTDADSAIEDVASQDITSDDAANEWWRHAVVYQIYPRSFSDLSGHGVGDLAGVIDKLGYLELLGVDAIWLSPIMRSPMADHGYDVSDPRDIDPMFGDLAVFDELIAEAHDRDLKVTMDLVPNHTSNQHRWFSEAIAARSGSPERDRYIFRQGRGEDGKLPPNNWTSVFGGSAWSRLSDGEWYLHLFAPEQPDLNWENPEVWEDLEKTLRFWLDRGVDGFRIDVSHGMAKAPGLPDMEADAVILKHTDDDPRFNNAAVHDIHRKIRSVMDEYPGTANVGEVWVNDNDQFAEYVRPDELHLGFNFRLASTGFDPESIRTAIDESLAAVASVKATPTWTLSNHDVEREVSRYAPPLELGDDPVGTERLAQAIGLARARAMALVELALPGTVFIYNGAELGLPNVYLPDEALQDPVWWRSGRTERGRDGCRVPIPWEGTEPPYGFSTEAKTWLPMPQDWAEFTVESQLEDVHSTLSLYRQAIELRYSRPELFQSTPNDDGDLAWFDGAPEGCIAFRRTADDEGESLVCVLNTNDTPAPFPPGQLLLTSLPLVDGLMAPNSAAWLLD